MDQWSRRNFLLTSTAAAAAAAVPKGLIEAQTASRRAAAGQFPKYFFWGAATSAMQVEGYPLADGGGKSIWYDFEEKPGAISDGSTNFVADDEYHLYPEDIGHMRQIGLNAYRFSVGWPRVLPQGKGQVNEKGLAYYDRLIDALLAAHLTPFLTVYHFDYPQALQKLGGWLNPDSPQWLADYAHLLTRKFSDRVENWLTINEPNILWGFGAEAAMMPPNLKLPDADLVRGSHNILLGHGKSVQAIRAAAKRPVKIGLPFAGQISIPASENPQDIAAAREASFSVRRAAIVPGLPAMAMLNNSWWLDPIYLGKYPQQGLKLFPTAASLATPEDMKIISQPLDYCAVNLYFGPYVKAGKSGAPETVPYAPGTPRTHYGWALTPELLYWGPKFLAGRYKKPILITENGMSSVDAPAADGKVHDTERTGFIESYLRNYKRAYREGVPLAGYFHWSLLDNWEFTQGFKQQFGLVYVNFKTQHRVVKDSAFRYREIIATRGAHL